MWELRAKINGVFNKGFNFAASYRDFSPQFKPRFRFSPAYYDDFFADQRGVKFEVTQVMDKIKFNGQYDSVSRGKAGAIISAGSFRGASATMVSTGWMWCFRTTIGGNSMRWTTTAGGPRS